MGARALDSLLAKINVILITPHGRAGSVFFQGLFDGHPEVANLPYFFNEYYQFDNAKDLQENITIFCKKNSLLFTAFSDYLIDGFEDKTREKYFIENISVAEFSREMLVLLKSQAVTSKKFLLAVYYSFYKIKGKSFKDIKYLLVHLHHYDHTDYFRMHTKEHELLLRDFPDLYYFPFFRSDVRITVMSYWNEMKNFYIIFDYFVCLKNSYRAFSFFSKKVKNLKVIELEELHARGALYMHELCEKLSIGYSPVLEECTFNGHKWFGRSVNFIKSSTFNSDRAVSINKKWNFNMRGYSYNQFVFYIFQNECTEKICYRRLFSETIFYLIFYLRDSLSAFTSYQKVNGGLLEKLFFIPRLFFFQSRQAKKFIGFLVKGV